MLLDGDDDELTGDGWDDTPAAEGEQPAGDEENDDEEGATTDAPPGVAQGELDSDPDANEVARKEKAAIAKRLGMKTGDAPAEGEEEDEDDDEEDEGEEEEEGEGEKSKGKFTVVLGSANTDSADGKKRDADFEFKTDNQELADTLNHMQRQVRRIPALEAARDQTQQREAVIDLMNEDPLTAMHVVEALGRTKGKADVGRAFVRQWIERNGTDVMELIEEMELDKMNERELRNLTAKAAKDQEDIVKGGLRTAEERLTTKRFNARGADAVFEASDILALDKEEQDTFESAAMVKLGELHERKPDASRADIKAVLEPIIKYFKKAKQAASAPKSKGPKNGKPTNGNGKAAVVSPQELVKRRVERVKTLERVGGGRSPLTALGPGKSKPGATLDDQIKADRRRG